MDTETFIPLISQELQIPNGKVRPALQLFENGATLPFIARYRKEATGKLTETDLAAIQEKWQHLATIAKRKETIRQTLAEQGHLTPEFEAKINQTWDTQTLEDLYLPYKPKKQTRATKARDQGLEPLARWLWQQPDKDVVDKAATILPEQIPDAETALQGARDIIAEWISEKPKVRQRLRKIYQQDGTVEARVKKGKKDQGQKYADYFDHQEPLKRIATHRLLALFRGEAEGILTLRWGPEKGEAITAIERVIKPKNHLAGRQIQTAIEEAYTRLLKPALDNEFRKSIKSRADEEAIGIFGTNLQQKLLAPPLGEKPVLAIDPGFQSGCKMAVLNQEGHYRESATIYPNPPQKRTEDAAKTVKHLLSQYGAHHIAVGDGTAGRETADWLKQEVVKETVDVILVNEDGASVYSASAIAREEHPDLDLTIRGAISIGRRLMDPLSELVKIDPKSLGIGQYQHDVDQTRLKAKLDQVVSHCVNKVGVNLNTASPHLLRYVAGLGQQLAKNIVQYRYEQGLFRKRKDLLKVPKLGAKAFEQAAGFLRIPHGSYPLDNTGIHPESYALVEQIAQDMQVNVPTLIQDTTLQEKIPWSEYVTPETGWPTLNDIREELRKPGRDPRPQLSNIRFDDTISKLEDLQEGMVLPGKVTNLTQFGAFVDIGIKENGLIHISEMADHYVKDPSQEVSLYQMVLVRVKSIDPERKRIQLSLKPAKSES